MSTKVITGVVRGSYLNLFGPRAQSEGAEPKYSMTMLIPKKDTVTKEKIDKAIEAATAAKWPNKRPAKVVNTLHDGDGARPSGEPFGPECKEHWVMTVTSKKKPGIVDGMKQEIINRDAFVSGDHFRVSINAYGYDNSGNKGVSFALNNVQFVSKGEPLGSHTRAEDDFDEIEGDVVF